MSSMFDGRVPGLLGGVGRECGGVWDVQRIGAASAPRAAPGVRLGLHFRADLIHCKHRGWLLWINKSHPSSCCPRLQALARCTSRSYIIPPPSQPTAYDSHALSPLPLVGLGWGQVGCWPFRSCLTSSGSRQRAAVRVCELAPLGLAAPAARPAQQPQHLHGAPIIMRVQHPAQGRRTEVSSMLQHVQ